MLRIYLVESGLLSHSLTVYNYTYLVDTGMYERI
jgi:hypothetical protein